MNTTTKSHFRVIGPEGSLVPDGMICNFSNNRIIPPFITADSIQLLQDTWDTDEDDIFICTHQKVGTHLTKKFVVEILRRVIDYPEGCGMQTGDIGHATVPWPEVMVSQYGIEAFEQFIQNTKGYPRVWYTHCEPQDLPFRSIHPKTKFIFTFRDPKGAAVSQYYFYKSHPLLNFPQEMQIDEFVNHFVFGKLYFGDYHRHTLDWVNGCGGRINPEQLLVLRYEDLVNDKLRCSLMINQFIRPQMKLNRKQVEEVVSSTAFDTMKKGIMENPGSFHFNPKTFFRSGRTDDWATQLSPESIQKIDHKTESIWSSRKTTLEAYRA
jgi:Sulfotransferase domain